MNSKRLVVAGGIIVLLVVIAGFGSGLYISNTLEQQLGSERKLGALSYSPDTVKTSVGFFSGRANIKAATVSSSDFSATIKKLLVSASIFDVIINAETAAVVVNKIPKSPIIATAISIQAAASDMIDPKNGVSPRLMIGKLESSNDLGSWSAQNIVTDCVNISEKEWQKCNLSIERISGEAKNVAGIKISGLSFNNENIKANNSYSLNYELGLNQMEVVSHDTLRDPLKFGFSKLKQRFSISAEIPKDVPLNQVFKELFSNKNSLEVVNRYKLALKKVHVSSEGNEFDYKQESIQLALKKFAFDYSESIKDDQSIFKLDSHIEGFTGQFENEEVSVKKISLSNIGNVETATLNKIKELAEFKPKDIMLVFNVFNNLKSESSVAVENVDIKSNKGNYSLDSYTIKSGVTGKGGNISLTLGQNIVVALQETQEAYFSPMSPPKTAGLEVNFTCNNIDISNFRNIVEQAVIHEKEPSDKDLVKALINTIIKKPKTSLKVVLDLETFSKALLSVDLAIKKGMPQNLSIDRVVNYISAKGMKGFNEFLKMLAQFDLELAIENYQNVLEVADKLSAGQAKFLFSRYGKLYKVDKNTVTSHLTISNQGVTINGQKNEITALIETLL